MARQVYTKKKKEKEKTKRKRRKKKRKKEDNLGKSVNKLFFWQGI